MTEKLKPAYEQFHMLEEPIKGVLVYHRENSIPIVGTLMGYEHHEYARFAFNTPILEDTIHKVSESTRMGEIYVPYSVYARALRELERYGLGQNLQKEVCGAKNSNATS